MGNAMTLRTNVSALSAQRALVGTDRELSTAMGRLSSGLRINTASDDAAGLAISEKLRAQVRSLAQAQRNANDGISLLQTAEGALNEISEMLIRMRELGMSSANGTLGTSERASLNQEFDALRAEIDRIAAVTEFNGTTLIDGSLSAGATFQVGIQNLSNDRIAVTLGSAQTTAIGISAAVSLTSMTGARSALTVIDAAISAVTTRRGDIGAAQNRLLSTINAVSAAHENLSAANSRIRDADIAAESTVLARSQVLMQAGAAILAQANQLPGMALSLIG